jgi:hypothetical protein
MDMLLVSFTKDEMFVCLFVCLKAISPTDPKIHYVINNIPNSNYSTINIFAILT